MYQPEYATEFCRTISKNPGLTAAELSEMNGYNLEFAEFVLQELERNGFIVSIEKNKKKIWKCNIDQTVLA